MWTVMVQMSCPVPEQLPGLVPWSGALLSWRLMTARGSVGDWMQLDPTS
jgi:hypothetical protein